MRSGIGEGREGLRLQRQAGSLLLCGLLGLAVVFQIFLDLFYTQMSLS